MTRAFVSDPIRFGSIAARPPLATPGQRIGLLGGSFNPAHAGHLQISKIARRRLGLDAVWWLVTPGNPLKHNDALPPGHDRAATATDLARTPWIKVSTFEARLGTAYSAATLAFLKRRYPATRFVWLMGADNSAGFHRWRDWRGIAQTMPIAVIDRPGYHLSALASPMARAFARSRVAAAKIRGLASRKPPAWAFIHGPLTDLSSTAIRENRR